MSSALRTWSYGRAFFLTLGLGLLGLTAGIWFAQGGESGEWPAYAWVLLWWMIVAGLLIAWFSFWGRNKAIRKWLALSGAHEGSLVIAIVAAPVYWIGGLFEKPRRRR